MPMRPQRPCRKAGCSALVDNGYCAAHASERHAHDRWRGTAASRGYDSDWSRIRLVALQRDKYLCQHCLAKDTVTVAVDVDHILPISQRPNLRLMLTNLQSLCRSCHRVKTLSERQ